MLLKTCLSLLIACLSFVAIAQPEEHMPQHYFELWASNAAWPSWEWLEVTVKLNDITYVKTFDSDEPYTFSLSEMDMSKQGSIQIISVRYEESSTRVIYTLPFVDLNECSLNVQAKNDYPDSTVTRISISNSGCAKLVRPHQIKVN